MADLYKKTWDIELFFRAMKENLQTKAFLGTSENAVKSQIYNKLISYLLLEFINRTISKKIKSFSNLVKKIRNLFSVLSEFRLCLHSGWRWSQKSKVRITVEI